MVDSEQHKTIWKIGIFALLVMALAFLGPLLGGSPSTPGLGFILWGTAPFLVALLLRVVTRDWSDAGLRPNIRKNAVWYVISLSAYVLVMGLVLLIGRILSITSISNFSLAAYLKTSLTALPIFFIFAFFEEFGWRGYLVPKLAAIKINGYLAHVIVGVLWATWHLPYLRELTWVYSSEEFLTFIPRLYLGAIAFSILYDEIRLVTGTFWPAVLMHAMGNSFGHPFAADYVTFVSGKAYLGSIGFDGLLMILCFAALGVAVKQWRSRGMKMTESFASS